MNSPAEQVKSACDRIRARLQARKNRLNEEIKCYPTPIAGCDQQFNYLLQQRGEIARLWSLVEQAEAESLTADDALAVIERRLGSSDFGDIDVRQLIQPTANERE